MYKILNKVNNSSKGGKKMKRINIFMVLILCCIMLVGCGNVMNTPTKKVESLLSKYQTQDKEVVEQLSSVVNEAGGLTDEQQEKYRNLMKRQYQNMSYKIKDEVEDGSKATVTVELQVFDYGKAIANSETYLANNRSEFIVDNDSDSDTIDSTKYMDYKIKSMEDTNEKVTYTISFTLTKVDDEWKINDLNDIDRLKLHGLYY